MALQPDPETKYGLTSQEWEKMREVEEKQATFHDWLKNKDYINTEEKMSLDCRSYSDFATYWTRESEEAKSIFDRQHQKGWRAWSRKFESFAAKADQFMEAFNPIVRVAQEATCPYGGLAIGTMCILFTVARRKSVTDDHIASAIADNKDRLPGLWMYEEIYSNHNDRGLRVKGKILLAYGGLIDLAIEAMKYYLKSAPKRWWTATWKPERFEIMTRDVQDKVVAVRLLCDELLHWTVNEIRSENTGLRTLVEELRDGNYNRYLLEVQELFGLSGWTIDSRREVLQEYKRSIDRENAEDRLFEAMRCERIEMYKESPPWRDWEAPGQSSMLLIVGANHEHINQIRRHCWMSPLAVDCMESFHASSVFHAAYTFDVWEMTDIHTAMPEILFQLLRWKRQALGNDEYLAKLLANLKEYRSTSIPSDQDTDEDAKRGLLGRIAVTTLQAFEPNETVYIVLDRIDRCQGQNQSDQDQSCLLNILIEAMEKAKCYVKVLAVANRTGWNLCVRDLKKARVAQVQQTVERQRLLGVEGWI